MFHFVVEGKDGRSFLIRSPYIRRNVLEKEHQVWMPVSVLVAEIALLGKHVAHAAGLDWRQFLAGNGGSDGLKHLLFRVAGQHQVCFLRMRFT